MTVAQLQAVIDASPSIAAAARQLGMAPNSLRWRMRERKKWGGNDAWRALGTKGHCVCGLRNPCNRCNTIDELVSVNRDDGLALLRMGGDVPRWTKAEVASMNRAASGKVKPWTNRKRRDR